MKTISAALLTYLNAFRPTADTVLIPGELFTIWLANGGVLTYTTLDLPVAWNGYVYLANSVLVSGLKFKSSCGASVDKQQITLFARSTDTLGGIAFMQALQQGAFDAAEIQREKAFFASEATSGGNLIPIGTVLVFKGRVAQIDEIGRTTAKITVASDLTLLDIDMPRNCYQTNCVHTLFDSGCGLAAGTYSSAGSVTSASSQTWINWSGSSAAFQQGTVTFTTGANAGVTATIKSASSTGFALAYPLPNAPGIGDTFSAAQGCDHTMGTCSGKFGNLSRFKGFPFVPPPQIMTGPLSSITTSSAKGK